MCIRDRIWRCFWVGLAGRRSKAPGGQVSALRLDRTRNSNADSIFVRLAGPTPRFDSSWRAHISIKSPSWRFKFVATDLYGIALGRNLSLMRKTRKPCGVCRSVGSLRACDFSVMFENQIVYRPRLTIFGVSPSSTTLVDPQNWLDSPCPTGKLPYWCPAACLNLPLRRQSVTCR